MSSARFSLCPLSLRKISSRLSIGRLPVALAAIGCASLLLTSTPAHAQSYDNAALMEKMQKMERDMQLMQRQLYRGGTGGTPAAGGGELTGATGARLEARLAQMEETLRRINGRIEEQEFARQRMTEQLNRMTADLDNLTIQVKQGAAAAGAGTPAGDVPPPMSETGVPVGVGSSLPENATPPMPSTPPDQQVMRIPTEGSPATPREAYNEAFKLLNQTRYEEAGNAFQQFTVNYPKDPLVGNAYYWLGETYYVRRDYVAAADNFRQGFEALPEGPKAADNLLKLSMSLSALQKNKEACVVLKQVVAKYGKTQINVSQKAQDEMARIGCDG